MKSFLHTIFRLILPSLTLLLLFSSCGDTPENPDSGSRDKFKRVILLYAVASNNLSSHFGSDKLEIQSAVGSLDLKDCSMLIYEQLPGKDPQLLELKEAPDGTLSFESLQTFSRNLFSTDPRRVEEVIGTVRKLRPSDNYGLILWSHGTGWTYSETVHPVSGARAGDSEDISGIVSYSFGMDKNGEDTDYINIDELAAAIPSGMFDFVWFDACYMSGIETIYEFRDKCSLFVGYSTEVWGEGMPYHRTLPYLLQEKPNLVAAAELFADYYDSSGRAFTIAVVETSLIEDLARDASEVYYEATAAPASSLHLYSRNPCGPFYDIMEFTSGFEPSAGADKAIMEHDKCLGRFLDTLDKMVVYSRCSGFDFRGYEIEKSKFSGINCHYFPTVADINDSYYRTLGWCKAVSR